MTHRDHRKPARSPLPSGREGSILFVLMSVLATLGILAGTVYLVTSADLKISANYKRAVEAFYNADAGVRYVKTKIEEALAAKTLTLGGNSITVSYPAPSGFTFDTVTNLTRMAEANSYLYRVTGRSGTARSTIEVVFRKLGQGFPFGLFGGEYVEIASSSQVFGSAGSNGNILLKSGSRVEGDARCGPGKTTTVDGSVVTGNKSPLPEKVVLDPIDPAAVAAAQASNKNGTIPAKFKSGTELYVKSGDGPLNLVAGTYYFTKVTIEDKVNVADSVTIYCTGDFQLLSSGWLNSAGEPRYLKVFCTGTGKAFIDSTAIFKGHIYGPKLSEASVKSSSTVHGSIIVGGKAYVDSSSKFYAVDDSNSGGGNKITIASWKYLRR